MKVIKRFDLSVEPEQKIKIPFNSEILSVLVINNKPVIFVILDPGDKEMERSFVLLYQDKDVPQRLNKTHHVASFELKAEVGSHIVHLFEER